MADVILKNNLEIQNRGNDYIKVKTKSSTIYAVVTMIIAFMATILFNINNYLPMLLCILFCLLCFLLSFYIVDFSNYDIVNEKIENEKNKNNMKFNRIIIAIFISYGLFLPVVSSGQSNGKLFIQQELFKNFDVQKTALILGAVLCISRVARVISNMSFNKVYKKIKEKVGIVLAVLLSISIMCLILGSFITSLLILKFVIMSFGYVIILFIRDPLRIYMQNLALNSIDKKSQQTLLTTMELLRKIIRAIMSLTFTLILIDNSMILVMIILFILSIVEIFISIKIYELVINSNKTNKI